jgi:hypothetical protein
MAKADANTGSDVIGSGARPVDVKGSQPGYERVTSQYPDAVPVTERIVATKLKAGDVVVWKTGRRTRLAHVSVKPVDGDGPLVLFFEWSDGLGPYASEPNAPFQVERPPDSGDSGLVELDDSYV